MKSFRKFLKWMLPAAMVLAVSAPSSLFACAACFGRSDSSLAHGMNWGIFTLMGIIVLVLATIASFFVYIIRKETAALNELPPQPQPQPEA